MIWLLTHCFKLISFFNIYHINALQSLFRNCEKGLECLDMRINAKKSCCVRIGPRFNATCTSIVTADGHNLPWVSQMRYSGIYFVAGRNMRCSVSYAQRSILSVV